MIPHAVRTQLADDAKQMVDLVLAERGRRLIHDQNACASAPKARAISTNCCSGIERLRTSVSGRIVEPMRSQQFVRPLLPSAPANSAARPRQAPNPVRCSRPRSDRETAPAAGRSPRCRAEREMTGSFAVTMLTIDFEVARRQAARGAGDDLDERRFACAVFADQAVNFSCALDTTRPSGA